MLVALKALLDAGRVTTDIQDPEIIGLIDWQLPFIAWVGIALLLAVFLVILLKGKPRQKLNIVLSDPPVRKPGDPAFIRRQAIAAAAAIVSHRKKHTWGELDENR
jgi:hypothetical protein